MKKNVTKWEYKRHAANWGVMNGEASQDAWLEALNYEGSQGWEAIGEVNTHTHDKSEMFVLLKRPVD